MERQMFLRMTECIFHTCNRYAYYQELLDIEAMKPEGERTEEDKKRIDDLIKLRKETAGTKIGGNFIPYYESVCMTCNKPDVTKKCSRCRVVRYCSEDCAKKAWSVHKLHCGRNLFNRCIACGTVSKDGNDIKCSKCPVRFCNSDCKQKIIADHYKNDCKKLAELFPQEQK